MTKTTRPIPVVAGELALTLAAVPRTRSSWITKKGNSVEAYVDGPFRDGPEIKLETLNGDILIAKRSKSTS